ncbi:hypothetical protein [Knoellia sp. LjRoot47]|uniref:hypothetical protein n=1 Tax=Knoellia sp. LjRoot47 TaxID=3342330 RepID=UPI003ECC9A38
MSTPEPPDRPEPLPNPTYTPPDRSWITTETIRGAGGSGGDWTGVLLGLALVILVVVLVRSSR